MLPTFTSNSKYLDSVWAELHYWTSRPQKCIFPKEIFFKMSGSWKIVNLFFLLKWLVWSDSTDPCGSHQWKICFCSRLDVWSTLFHGAQCHMDSRWVREAWNSLCIESKTFPVWCLLRHELSQDWESMVERWRFSKESSTLWYKVILSVHEIYPNGWDTNIFVRWLHHCPWKAIKWVRNSPVASILSLSSPFGRNFNFCHNLTDLKIEDLESLMSILDCVRLSPSSPNVKVLSLGSSSFWSLSFSSFFMVKLFFLVLIQLINSNTFLSNKIHFSKVTSKVKTFAWLVANKRVNTNDLL